TLTDVTISSIPSLRVVPLLTRNVFTSPSNGSVVYANRSLALLRYKSIEPDTRLLHRPKSNPMLIVSLVSHVRSGLASCVSVTPLFSTPPIGYGYRPPYNASQLPRNVA